MRSILATSVAVGLAASSICAGAQRGDHESDACGTVVEEASKTSDVEFAGIIPGRGLGPEDFAGDGLLIEADPTLYLITDDPIGVLQRAAHNWEIPGTMIKFRIGGPGSGGCIVRAENIKQAARASVGRPGWGRDRNLYMILDVPFSRGDDSLVAVVTHEMGHWLGFDHAFLGATVMYPILTDRINWVDPDQVGKAVARYGVAPNALGEVRGRVTRHGAPLSGARVNILGVEHRTAFGTFSGSDGVFHVPAYAGTYSIVIDPNDGPAVAGNFIGTYPGGPLNFVTYEVPGTVAVGEGASVSLEIDVPDGDDAFKITTAEPTTCGPGAGAQSVAIYYSGALQSEIAGVEPLSPDLSVYQISDVDGRLTVYFDVAQFALPGPRGLLLRKTNGAVALLPGAVGIVAPLRFIHEPFSRHYDAGSPIALSWVNEVPRDAASAIVVSASADAGASWEEVGRAQASDGGFTWQPDPNLVTPTLRFRIEGVNASSTRFAVDETQFNIGLGTTARGDAPGLADVEAPEVSVLSPNGGETFALGEPVRIAWNAGDDIGVVSSTVEISRDGGRRWTEIATLGPLDRSVEWTPDGAASEDVLARVTARDAAGNAVQDVSDSAFRVRRRPVIESVSIKPKGALYLLKLGGSGFAANAVVTVNDAAVSVPVKFNGVAGSLKLKGDTAALHLNPSGQANTIVVTVDGLASAAVVTASPSPPATRAPTR